MAWQVTQLKKVPKLKDSIFVEGLPGIGNVGKIAIDFVIDQLKPVEIYDFYSHSMPHSVFVNKDSLVELPKIRMYALKRGRKPDLVIMSGDIQPIDEISSHEFVETVLAMSKELGIKSIITLGGIGMSQFPKDPHVYITGNSKEAVNAFADKTTRRSLVGVVGPIVGVTGLMIGLAGKQKMPAIAYLVESFAHPLHVGTAEARVLLELLDRKLQLGLKLKEYDKSIAELEKAVRSKIKEMELTPTPLRQNKETSYIG